MDVLELALRAGRALAARPDPLVIVTDLGLEVVETDAFGMKVRREGVGAGHLSVDGDGPRALKLMVSGKHLRVADVEARFGHGGRPPRPHFAALPTVLHDLRVDDARVRLIWGLEGDRVVEVEVMLDVAPPGELRDPERTFATGIRYRWDHLAAAAVRQLARSGRAMAVVTSHLPEASGEDVEWVRWLDGRPALLDRLTTEILVGALLDRVGPTSAPVPRRAEARAPSTEPAPRGRAWTAEERTFLLRSLRDARDAMAGAVDAPGEAASLARTRPNLFRRLYVGGTPLVPIARHPRTGEIVRHAFDPFGTDGPWWDAVDRYRPESPPARGGWLQTTGGWVSGPQPPGRAGSIWGHSPVSQRLLDDGATGVMVRLQSGETVVDVVSWFSPDGREIEPAPELGRTEIAMHTADGRFAGYARVAPLRLTAELAGALDSGQLLWVFPGDAAWTLRRGREACPFVDAQGRWVGATPRASAEPARPTGEGEAGSPVEGAAWLRARLAEVPIEEFDDAVREARAAGVETTTDPSMWVLYTKCAKALAGLEPVLEEGSPAAGAERARLAEYRQALIRLTAAAVVPGGRR